MKLGQGARRGGERAWASVPGTHLSEHARQLREVHAAVIGGTSSHGRPRDVVARSWSRVLAFGLDPDREAKGDRLELDEVEQRRRESPLSRIHAELTSVAASVAAASPALMVVTDAEGVVLWRSGSSSVRRQADSIGFTEGAKWTETNVGTNAIGTALVESAPVQLFSAEHFAAAQHQWYCSAYPIHDPRTGSLLGIVDVSGPALSLQPAIAALVETTVRLAESQLWRRHQEALGQLRRQAEPAAAAAHGPLLVVDDNGWVAYRDGVQVGDRIAAPIIGRPMSVPGLGLCESERLHKGWLIRPIGAQSSIRAVLELGASPVLEVSGGPTAWRTSLTPRHAELLRALATAGQAGQSARTLSRMLFGDEDHVVAVRAEVSRLRRKIGALITAQPYRIANGVQLSIAPPQHRSNGS